MANAKKVLLFVVEGQSEEVAFGILFKRLFGEHAVMFDVVRGDITTAWSETRGVSRRGGEPNARNRLRDHLVQHIMRQPYEWKDLLRIVQITDTDGAFVDDCFVREVSDARGVRYSSDHMEARDRNKICERNRMKKRALVQMHSSKAITYGGIEVPYAVYYLSRNMEHVLHGCEEDVSDAEKGLMARRFQMRYKNDLEGFAAFLHSEELAVLGNYDETWRFISEECHSLERHSNLHLVLPSYFM